MFRLVLDSPDGSSPSPLASLPESERYLIGSESSLAPLFVPFDYPLRKTHALIEQRGEAIWVENLAHDPKTLINGTPFFRKKARHGDILKIGPLQWVIHEVVSLGREGEEESETISYALASEKPAFLSKKTTPFQPENTQESDSSRVLYWLALSACILFSTIVVGTLTYLAISEKSLHHEKKAILGLADVAMSITYAKAHQLSFDKNNVLDPDHINPLANTLLSESYATPLINHEGYFFDTPYFLRIYFDNQMNRFILIAQPSVRLAQHWIPRSALLFDSKTMIIHRISDLRALNRLLVHMNTLDEMNHDAFETLLIQSPPVALSHVAKNLPFFGLQPPSEIDLIPNGSVYRVDLLPRYFQWKKTAEQITRLHLPAPHIIYVDGGLDAALAQRQNLKNNLMNQSNIPWIGYFDQSEKNQTGAAHLLVLSPPQRQHESIAFVEALSSQLKENILQNNLRQNNLGENEAEVALQDSTALLMDENFDAESPPMVTEPEYLTALKFLAAYRSEQLEHIHQSLAELFQDVENLPQRTIDFYFSEHTERIRLWLRKIQDHIDHHVEMIFDDWVLGKKKLSMVDFFQLLQTYHIENGFLADLKNLSIEDAIEKIQHCQNLASLDQLTQWAMVLQQKEGHSSPEDFYAIRTSVIQKLELLLWQSQEPLVENHLFSPTLFNNLSHLWYILKALSLNDQDTLEFYFAQMAHSFLPPHHLD